MNEATTGSGRATRSLKFILIWALVLGLLAAVAYLLCERNARLFGLEQRDGELRVMRGRFLPAGRAPYLPDDRVFARAYAPLPVAGEPLAELELPATYADRDELDRALFTVVKRMIEARLGTEDPVRLGDAVKLLRRAELLGGVLEEQRLQLKDLQARVAFFEGRSRLDEAVASLRSAVDKLQLAGDTANQHSLDAGELHDRIAPLADQLAYAARQPLAGTRREAVGEGKGRSGAEALLEPADAVAPSAPSPVAAISPEAVPGAKVEVPAALSPAPAGSPGAAPEANPEAAPHDPGKAAPSQNR